MTESGSGTREPAKCQHAKSGQAFAVQHLRGRRHTISKLNHDTTFGITAIQDTGLPARCMNVFGKVWQQSTAVASSNVKPFVAINRT
jgi:hypothetical protein